MALTLPIVWNDACLLHAPGAEIWLGVRMPDDEGPERAGIIRDAPVAEGAEVTDRVRDAIAAHAGAVAGHRSRR